MHLEAGTFFKVVVLLCHASCPTAFKNFMNLIFFCIGYKMNVNFEEMYTISRTGSSV